MGRNVNSSPSRIALMGVLMAPDANAFGSLGASRGTAHLSELFFGSCIS
jgi:hypothetical protein